MEKMKGWLKPAPIEVLEGGWGNLLRGEEMLRRAIVRGRKLGMNLD